LNFDIKKKSLLKKFPCYLKNMFSEIYDNSWYEMSIDKRKLLIEEFYTKHMNMPGYIFEANVGVLTQFLQIQKKTRGRFKYSEEIQLIAYQVFHAKPSISNCKKAFSNEAIQGLWSNRWGSQLPSFIDSEVIPFI
jgi:hypothetical protein